MSANPSDGHARPGLVRGLGLWAATAVVIGDTIGSGIFLVSSDMARITGSTALVFAAWILGGVIVLFGAFCYAELGAMFPKAGGPYVYLTEGLGPLWGFLFGWMSDRLGRRASLAVAIVAFSVGNAICGLAPEVAWLVIGRGKGAAQESIHAKKGEVVAGDELGSKRIGNSVTASASNSHG